MRRAQPNTLKRKNDFQVFPDTTKCMEIFDQEDKKGELKMQILTMGSTAQPWSELTALTYYTLGDVQTGTEVPRRIGRVTRIREIDWHIAILPQIYLTADSRGGPTFCRFVIFADFQNNNNNSPSWINVFESDNILAFPRIESSERIQILHDEFFILNGWTNIGNIATNTGGCTYPNGKILKGSVTCDIKQIWRATSGGGTNLSSANVIAVIRTVMQDPSFTRHVFQGRIRSVIEDV